MEPKVTRDAGWGDTEEYVSSAIRFLGILFRYYFNFIFEKYVWRLKCRFHYKARLEDMVWLWSHMGLLTLPYFEFIFPSAIFYPCGDRGCLGLLCGWRNRPEHTCIVQARLPATGLIKDEFRKPGLWGWGLGVDECEQRHRLLCG